VFDNILHKGREEVTILALKHLQVEAAQSVPFKVLLIVVLVSTRRCRALKRLGRPEPTFPGVVVKFDH